MSEPRERGAARMVGRYALHGEIASGGMATVHYGRLIGSLGFSRTVAIKRLHVHLAKDPEFVSMLLDEARIAARIQHPNVVPTLDVVTTDDEIFLVMEYVQGESLARLLRAANAAKRPLPVNVVVTVLVSVLHGLHAAHEAKNERGEALGVVHRDVSPHNIMVGVDGVARVLDFGVAKAAGRLQTTRQGQLKGKLAYMAPEQIQGTTTRATDIFAASVVLWEALVRRRLFDGENEAAVLAMVLSAPITPPTELVPDLPPELDAIVMRGLDRDPAKRFATAREMARALERCVPHVAASDIGDLVESLAARTLAERTEKLAQIESNSTLSARALSPVVVSTAPSMPPEATTETLAPTDADPPARAASSPSVSSASRGRSGAASGALAGPTEPAVAAPEIAPAPALESPRERAASVASQRDVLEEPNPFARRKRWPFVAAGGAVAALALGVWAASGSSDAPAVLVASPAASASVVPSVEVPVVVAAPATSESASAPVASASAAPAKRVFPGVAPGGGKGGCSTPFTVDASGYKHYKKECLR